MAINFYGVAVLPARNPLKYLLMAGGHAWNIL